MKGKRVQKRYTKRLETEFSSGDMTFRGISSDLSERGLFIRTQHGFVPGATVDIRLQLPDGTTAVLKGKVRRTVKTHLNLVKNGMGIEIIESDSNYERFLREEVMGLQDDDAPGEEPPVTITCSLCGVKNRVMETKLYLKPKCGRCGAYLT